VSAPASRCDDRSLWPTLIDEYLAPPALWPERVYRLPGLRYPAHLNLAEQLLAAAKPGAMALVWRRERITYAELRARVLAAAAALHRIGVAPADRVALRFHNTPDFIVAWLAVQWVGAIGVPIPPIYRRREIRHVLDHSGARVLVCAADLTADVEAALAACADATVAVVTALRGDGDAPPPYPMDSDWPALITYITSATGPAKGVVHSPIDLLATADTYAREVLRVSPDDVCVGLPSIAWSYPPSRQTEKS